jgi:hypothetical protein
MSKEYTLIYFKRTGCGHCKRFDEADIFHQLEERIKSDQKIYPVNTLILDSFLDEEHPEIKKEQIKHLQKYNYETTLFSSYKKGVPSLCLIYDSTSLPSIFGKSLKIISINIHGNNSYLPIETILEEIKEKMAVISAPSYANPTSLGKKYLKYKYKYLELKNKYLQQKNNI